MSEEATRKAERNSLMTSRDWRTLVARRGGGLGYIDRDTMEWIPRDTVTDKPKNWKLIAEAREWSRSVEVNPDWRKGLRDHALHHVARLTDALEAAGFPGDAHANGGAMIPRGNIIPETYREYVEWRERKDLVDGSELRRRIEGQIAMREGWEPFRGTDFGPTTRGTERRIFKKVLRMLDELEAEG